MDHKLRSTNFELLRILSILFIIIFHGAYYGGFVFTGFTFNKYVIECFRMLGELGVNVFVLISGYHMIHCSFKRKKLINLWLLVSFYNWIHVILSVKLGVLIPDVKTIIQNFFPITSNVYWFATAYLLLFIFTPYINSSLKSFDKKTLQKFLIISFIVFSLLPTLYGVFLNTSENILFCNRFVWILFVYAMGGYLRLHYNNDYKCIKFLLLFILMMMFIFISIYLLETYQSLANTIGLYNGDYFWHPNTVPLVLASVSLFLVFAKIEITPNIFINYIASTTFGIYLYSDGQLGYYIWWYVFHAPDYQNDNKLALYMVIWTLIIFIVGVFIETIRKKICKLLNNGIYHIMPLISKVMKESN